MPDYLAYRSVLTKIIASRCLAEITKKSQEPSITYPIKNTDRFDFEIEFTDLSKLEGFEEYSPAGDLLEYEFLYERNSSTFCIHFERERNAEAENKNDYDWIRKPLHHMHIGLRDPDKVPTDCQELRFHGKLHYETKPLKLNDVLAFIIVNYFPEKSHIIESLNVIRESSI